MQPSRLDELIERFHEVQSQLEQELDRLLAEKRERFRYDLARGKVVFEQGVHELQRRYRTGLWTYLRNARAAHVLTAPVIYAVIFPLLLMDLALTVYQQVCFRAYGIPRVSRSDYIVIDRQHLDYLNALEKLNCVYCGYANGLVEYMREIISRTEQYWCPIKHARRPLSSHPRVERFADYGDAASYREKLRALREELK